MLDRNSFADVVWVQSSSKYLPVYVRYCCVVWIHVLFSICGLNWRIHLG